MISKSEKKKIIKYLGSWYSNKIKEHLDANGILNKNGKSHSLSMIRNVMNGEKSHEEIEASIFELVKKTKAETKAKKKQRDQILN